MNHWESQRRSRTPLETAPIGTVQLKRIVYKLWTRLGLPPVREVTEDCLQEARISLWRVQARLEALPQDARASYAAACAHHAASRVMRQEMDLRARRVPLEETGPLLVAEMKRTCVDSDSDQWLASIADEVTARRIAALPVRDRAILHLYYAHWMTDREIAVQTDSTERAVERQRHRILQRLRARR